MPELPLSAHIFKTSPVTQQHASDQLTIFTTQQLKQLHRDFSFSYNDKRADFVAAYPELDDVCQRIGFGWDQTLGAWCSNAKWALEELARACKPRPIPPSEDWTSASIDELVEHLLTHYHIPLRWELTRLGYLITRLAEQHSDRKITNLETGFNKFKNLLLAHLMQEELEAFPLCIKLEQLSHHATGGIDAHASETLHFMAAGHHETVDDLEHLQLLTNSAIAVNDPDLHIIQSGLVTMKNELIEHTKIENGILLPAAIFMADLLLARHKI